MHNCYSIFVEVVNEIFVIVVKFELQFKSYFKNLLGKIFFTWLWLSNDHNRQEKKFRLQIIKDFPLITHY
jgi:hypothetical protein